jgi:hypothetical protein
VRYLAEEAADVFNRFLKGPKADAQAVLTSDGMVVRSGSLCRKEFAKTGHGGKIHLRGRDPMNFQWSIVRTVSTAMSERDVIRIESLEKEKHGSRAVGLNGN